MANIESSSEFQDIVLSTVMKNTYMFSRTYRYITEEFYTKYSDKLIYKSLRYYYDKYSKLPSLNELLMVIENFYTQSYGDIEQIKQECKMLYDTPMYDEEFVQDCITKFIRRNNVEKTLKDLLPQINDGRSLAIDQIGEKLAEGLDFTLEKSFSFRLSDTKSLPSVRKKAVGSDDGSLIIKSFVEPINNALMFKGYKPGDVVCVVAAPGSGKTMYMVNEGANAAMQDFNVLHLFLGDMSEYDGFIRYASKYTQIPQDKIVGMTVDEQCDLIRKFNIQSYFSHIVVSSYAAGEITVDEMIQEVYRLQSENHMHFDLINVDYADNLVPEDDSMYTSGGKIYNKLSYLAFTNRSVVIVGSQPKQEYWESEIIPKNGAAESSKKQHVIDLMLTLGKVNKTATIGSIFLAKVRRGQEGKIIRFKTHFERASFDIISEKEYSEERSQM